MASRKDIEAGKAHVTLYANNNPLMQGLRAVEGKVTSWGKRLMGIGAGITAIGMSIVGAFAGAVAIFANTGSEIADIAAKTNMSAAAIAELGYAAEQSGSSLETVGKALIAMQKQGLDPKRFNEVAEAISAIPDDVDRTNAALAAFGKSGADLLPMLAEVAMLRRQARELGIIPSEEAVQDAAKIGDKFDQIKSQIIAGIFEIGAAFAPVVLPILDNMTSIGRVVLTWIRNNAALTRTIAMIGAGLVVIGSIVLSLGTAFVAIGIAIGGVTIALAAIGPVLAAVFSPIGLVVGAIVAIGVAILAAAAYWLFFTNQGKAALAGITASFTALWNKFQEVFTGITDALMAGELGLAAEIGAKGIEVAFFKVINAILDKILFIPHAIIDAMEPLVAWDPTGNLEGLLIASRAALNGIQAGYVGAEIGGTEELQKKLAQARAARETAFPEDNGNSGQYGSSGYNAPAMGTLKSLGSFNATALTMQNYGKGVGKAEDPQKKSAEWLKKLVEKLMPDLIEKTKDNKVVFGS